MNAKTYYPNPVRLAICGVCVILTLAIAAPFQTSSGSLHPRLALVLRIGLVAIPSLVLLWLATLRLVLDDAGISYRSLLSRWHMEWSDVDEVYIEKERVLVNGIIPMPVTHRVTLRSAVGSIRTDSSSRKFLGATFTVSHTDKGMSITKKFGSNFGDCPDICEAINSYTFPLLWSKVRASYAAGGAAAFGGVEVSRTGISVNVWSSFGFSEFGKPQLIPWGDLASYDFQDGHFRLLGRGKELAKIRVASIPNLHILVALLQSVQPQNSAFARA